jgi:hypothetical protein
MKLVSQKALERAPEGARAQMSQVSRGEDNLGFVAPDSQLVGTAEHRDAGLDPEALLDDFELNKMGRLNDLHELHEMPSRVRALDGRSHAGFVAVGAHRMRQQEAQEERRARGNFLVHQHSLPNHLGGGVEVHRGCDKVSGSVAREEPTCEAEQSCEMRLGRRRRQARDWNGCFGILPTSHIANLCAARVRREALRRYVCFGTWMDSRYFTRFSNRTGPRSTSDST